MQRTHKIRLDPTCKQRRYFARASGTHRFVFNWALAEWNRQYEAGEKPNSNNLKKQFNATYKEAFPWVSQTHRDCHSQPFADLQTAFGNFFAKRGREPVFKSRNKDRRSFYVANDKFNVDGKSVRLPKIGTVRMRESLRFAGKINCARVVEDCGEWYICISVDVGESKKQRTASGIIGVDLGIITLAKLSEGEDGENFRPLRKAQERLRRANRQLHRRIKGSKNRAKQRRTVARIHRRIRNIRHDNLHKLTTRICRENRTVVIEDLNVAGMIQNHRLAQAISDASFAMLRSFLAYKAETYVTELIVADQWYPSSKKCSRCGLVMAGLSLGQRIFRCECGEVIDRDHNAALNLRSLGLAKPEVTATEMPAGVVEVATIPCPQLDTL
jgi:putative transposase